MALLKLDEDHDAVGTERVDASRDHIGVPNHMPSTSTESPICEPSRVVLLRLRNDDKDDT